jgi:hypothetical protein
VGGVVAAWAAGEHVAHGINPHREAAFLAPAAKLVATLEIDIGQGVAFHPTFWGRTDLRDVHQTLLKLGAGDAIICIAGYIVFSIRNDGVPQLQHPIKRTAFSS